MNLRDLLEEEAADLPGTEPTLEPDGSLDLGPDRPHVRRGLGRRQLGRIRTRSGRR